MKGRDQVINERVSFLKEQINRQNRPLVNRTFEIQIETIRSANTEEEAVQVPRKQKQLENAKDMASIERLCNELGGLWKDSRTGSQAYLKQVK